MSDREAFEKWAEDNYMLGYSNGKYVSRFTQCAWEGWQADRSQTLLEVIRDDSGCPVEVRVVEAMQGETVAECSGCNVVTTRPDGGEIKWCCYCGRPTEDYNNE
jgi:hypothetical protein